MYLEAAAERLLFDDNAFDLVISYLSLIDILNMQSAISEMGRVLNYSWSFDAAGTGKRATRFESRKARSSGRGGNKQKR